MIKAAILTISDKGSRGEREDKSGQVIREKLGEIQAEVVAYEVIPDERVLIAQRLKGLTEVANLLLTTGGTGVSPRDVTPEATRDVIEKELPGFAEAMRAESFKITPRALGSRAISGIHRESLIINLPGSPKAVAECLDVVLMAIPHVLELLKGNVEDCARK
ncbi:MAG: MogA/MoaB family molybdenum cofactor biosynthesis protein [Candidatus Scalindua sp. AMX11]|nr:MogA/MoaB family molybdenum cofactor biosynthesis protein [Planctomycetota bacterium]RZV62763.1 MAG: MogA/MoaB family molybdenum cofactor biosynthesis protein [Candidatus Scalindua sp. SCAELEC01]TDE63329.1 MAG: MogA/MoaB family molybdenum cofactor biosynthesis protein [Candidatus Scalindua sp. AMX11]GJQ60890.1 MAG: molybdenum cofactor biosynthesis protein [Candidatus Scalindua sp.]